MNSNTALDANNHIVMAGGEKVTSKVIYVKPGEAALLTLIGAQEQYTVDTDRQVLIMSPCIEIKRVYMEDMHISEIEQDCGSKKSHSRIADALVQQQKVVPHSVYQCGEPWSISPCNNLKLIDVPGFYVAELDDLSQLEELRLEYSILTSAQAAGIQSYIRLGA